MLRFLQVRALRRFALAMLATLGIAAVNFGPGDPNLVHHDEERVPLSQLTGAEAALLRWVAGSRDA